MPRRMVLLGATALLLAGCSHRRTGAEHSTPARDQGWKLTVNNRHWLDVSIYVMSEGGRSHVGLVSATRVESYEMAPSLIQTGRMIVLEADPVGGARRLRTERLSVQEGQHVEWTIENGLERASVVIW